ncbi:hypothetical protein IPA_06075 [Ignicoccus pacificus DSM 13166]|uniref:Uncharacterized protein n=1 Tax=Ignicoccus pacificus DSM 13166 TaxID=940294 RepID=A0A977KCQ1_9CREN|nr:hypothetical protein IPA_06075 [Ignicoccus pacificus DSM 13166]
MAVNPKLYPCFGDYEKCPIYQAEMEGDCSSCPLADVCGKR